MPAAHAPSTTTTDGDIATAASLRGRIQSHLGIDPRALGAFRIGIGLVIIADLLVLRAPQLAMFYTDDGVFPRATLAEVAPTLARWSLYAISGSLWVQALWLGLTVVLAACLLVGYLPRFAAVGTAVLLASLHARNPYLVNGGDTILISVLFLAAFLPLDAQWSLRRRPRPDDDRILSIATATILLHVVVIYAINAVLKFQSEAWTSGVAVQRIFQLEDFVYLLGPTLAEYPAVLTGINWLWTAVLSASVLLVAATGWLRIATVVAFIGAHLSMAATMRLGAFPFVMCAVLVLFLPPRLWDAIDQVVTKRDIPSRLEPIRREIGDSTPSGTRLLVRRGLRVTATGLLVCLFIVLVGWQLVAADLVETPSSGAGSTLESASWAFFAPNPPDSYSWYVVEAEYESGTVIDLVDGETVDFDRPPNAMERYPTTLWKRYGTKSQGVDGAAQPVAANGCERTSADVESVTIYRVEQPVDADGPVGEPIPHQQATVACG
ncbi:HTTM domain-containing protein [Natrinema limicola]|uniref:HTTM domain protein n=1 Tax=Natrinema limicola JCM 13563 TaxID=1230457 RepID=M0CGY5_9EURY|nr:HTTM domain-containing protein [Natrinema limicola]ELZ21617.1 HTTM domain protein [Natrinema limicola JCM 13563]